MNLVKKFLAGVASVAVALTTSLASVSVASAAFSDLNGHWAKPFVDELASKGIISTTNSDGTPKTKYYPDNSLTRAELTKLAVEAFYGDTVSDLKDAFADAANPSFTDVPADAWYFPYVEIAKGLDIVQGVGGGKFAPNAPITRAAALKVILLSGQIEDNLDPAAPFVDVPANEWYHDFVTTAYNDCIVNGTSDTTFTPNGNVTRGEAAKILLNAMKVSDGEDICTGESEPEQNPPKETKPTEPNEPKENPNPTFNGVLEVSKSADSPDSQSIPQNGSNIPFLKLDLTNTGDEDIKVKGIVISHGGLGDENDIENVKVFDGIRQRGSDRPFTSDEEIAPLNLSSEPVVVAAGTTKTIVIAGDTNASTAAGEHSFNVLDPSDITAVTESGADVEVAGDFPIIGATMRIANVQIGSLDFQFKTVADNEIEVGQSDVELARIQVDTGSAEDVLLQAMTFEFNGADAGDFANLYVEYQGQRISDIVDFNTDGEFVTFDLTNNDDGGWILADGDNKTIRVKGDVVAGVSNTVTVNFDQVEADVIATGLTYGFGVKLTDSGTPDAVKIIGGDITFAFSSTAHDVPQDSDNVEFGVLTISNLGEAVELRKNMTLNVNVDVPASVTTPLPNTFLQNVRLVDLQTGKTFMGPEDLTGNPIAPGTSGTFTVVFSDEQVLETGDVLELSLQADINQGVDEGVDFDFELVMDTVEVKGIESNDTSFGGTTVGCAGTSPRSCEHDIRPTGNPNTDTYTIANPSVTFTGKTLNSDNYVEDADDVVVWKGTVRADDVEDVIVRRVDFTQLGTADENDIDGFSLFKKEGNVLTPLETNQDLNGNNVSFVNLDEDGGSQGILVPAGDEFELILTADISSTVTVGHTINMTLDVSNLDAEDETGDTAVITNTANIPAGAIFSLVASGSVAVELNDENTPDSAIVLAGQTSQPLAVFQFEAVDEDVRVKDLTVKINPINTGLAPDAVDFNNSGAIENAAFPAGDDVPNDTEAIDAVTLYYFDDGTPVKKTTGNAAVVPTLDTNDEAFFQGLDLVVKDGEELLLEVRADLKDMDNNNANATARSGMTFTASLDLTHPASELRGVDSGDILNDAAITVKTAGGASDNPATANDDITGAGDKMFVFNNKVIAEKSGNQPTNLAAGSNKELMKVTLNSSGDNTDSPFLEAIKADVDVTNSSGGSIAVTKVYLLNDNNDVIAQCTTTNGCFSGSTYTLLVGDADESGAIDGGETAGADQIDGGQEVYKIQADITGTTGSNGASLTTTVFVNGSNPNTSADTVTWKDGGSDGTDGVSITWIDLGSADQSTTRIENTISANN